MKGAQLKPPGAGCSQAGAVSRSTAEQDVRLVLICVKLQVSGLFVKNCVCQGGSRQEKRHARGQAAVFSVQ